MRERDARDRGRSVAPLKPADDAYVLDSSALDADEAFAAALVFITSRRKD
jgi:cytidylate kinase